MNKKMVTKLTVQEKRELEDAKHLAAKLGALMVPFLVDELYARAEKGNQTAKSIIASAEVKLKNAQFQHMVMRLMG